MPQARRQIGVLLTLLGVTAFLTSPAYAQYFGKNKVHYKEFAWSVLQTDHFQVYFYRQEETMAIDAARMAERAYVRLARIFRHRFVQPIPLILYASHTDFQQTNITPELINEGTGGVTELLKNRVFLPFTGSYKELEHVLTHELTHAFQVDILFGNTTRVGGTPLSWQPPLWFMEGMAEYLALGEIDPHTRMWLHDAALENSLPTLEAFTYTWDIRAYRFGQGFWTYLAKHYSDTKVGEILHKTALLRNVNVAFQAATGQSLETLFEAWKETVRKDAFTRLGTYDRPKTMARLLTGFDRHKGFYDLAPALSPDGSRVVFISDRSLYNDIYLASARDGRILKRLVKGERSGDFESLRFFQTTLAWGPKGRLLAFPAKIGPRDAIYILDVQKAKLLRRLTFALDGVLSPTWSPDGTELALVGFKGGQADLYRVRADGTGLTRLTRDRYTEKDPHWSPDGKHIAFSTDRGSETDFGKLLFGSLKIALYDLTTGEVRLLPHQAGNNWNPQWSPDGQSILFISDRTGTANLYLLTIASCRLDQLTDFILGVSGLTGTAPAISWSRDGQHLVFSAFAQSQWHLYRMDRPLEQLIPALDCPVCGLRLIASVQDKIPPQACAACYMTGPPIEAGSLPDSVCVADDNPPTPGSSQLVWENRSLLPDPRTFKTRDYQIELTPDFLGGAGGYATGVGFIGQGAISFSDVLGDHNFQVYLNGYGDLADTDLYLAYTNRAHRTNYRLALFQVHNDLFIFGRQGGFQIESLIYRGAETRYSFPFDRFSRIEYGFSAVAISRKTYFQDYWGLRLQTKETGEGTYYFSPSFAFVKDNALYGWTGPISGTRRRISLEPAVGGLQFVRLLTDLREYLNIKRDYVLALRFLGFASVGRDRQLLWIGGPYTLRGMNYGALTGTRIALFNLEFRFPLIDYLKLGWPLPLAFRGVRGVFFFDLAGAWDRQVGSTDLIFGSSSGSYLLQITQGLYPGQAYGAYGVGARTNLGLLVLRFDLAQLTDFKHRVGKWKGWLSIGADF